MPLPVRPLLLHPLLLHRPAAAVTIVCSILPLFPSCLPPLDADDRLATLIYTGAAVAIAGLGYYMFAGDSSAKGKAQGMADEAEGKAKGLMNQAEGKVRNALRETVHDDDGRCRLMSLLGRRRGSTMRRWGMRRRRSSDAQTSLGLSAGSHWITCVSLTR